MSTRRAVIVALAAAMTVAGCTARPSPRPVPAPVGSVPTADEILASLSRRRATVLALRAMARVSYVSPEESRTVRQLLVVARPDRLWLEIFSPFGTVFLLAAANGRLAAWARDEATVYRGSASAENLQRYAQVDLNVPTAVDLLLATPPLRDSNSSVVSVDGDAIELWQDLGDLVQAAWFSGALEPLRYEQRAADGRVLLRTSFAAYAGGPPAAQIASQVAIEQPPAQRRLDIVLSDVEVNPVLPDSVFALVPPAGSAVVDLDHTTP